MVHHRPIAHGAAGRLPLLVAALALGTAVPNVGAQPAAFTLDPCRIPGVTEEARCGTYQVWEDRQARTGRQVSLRVVLVPARDSDAAPDPVLVLQGGPGASNVASAAGMARHAGAA